MPLEFTLQSRISGIIDLGTRVGGNQRDINMTGIFNPITMQDVRLATGEGILSTTNILDAVNAVLRNRKLQDINIFEELQATYTRIKELEILLREARGCVVEGSPLNNRIEDMLS
jgi:hypothetical protein